MVSQVGVEGGIAFLWAVGGAAGRTSSCPFSRLPSHPRHHKGPGGFPWKEPKPLARLSSLPTSSWGTRDHREK